MSRAELKRFLEDWGTAVYDDEPTSDLREAAYEYADEDVWSTKYRGVPAKPASEQPHE